MHLVAPGRLGIFLVHESWLAHEMNLAHELYLVQDTFVSRASRPADEPVAASKQAVLYRRMRELLEAAFAEAGWKVRPCREVELLVQAPRGGPAYAVALKASRDGRRELLPALLARAALEAQHYARAHPGVAPLAVVAAPRMSKALSREVEGFAERYLEKVAFGWVDATGRLSLRGQGLDTLVARDAPLPPHVRAPRPTRAFPLFSDLNQWMLKVLLAPRVPEELLHAPREQASNARHLALLAGTSVPSASRLVAHLRENGMLQAASRGLELVQVPALLLRWQRSVSGHVAEERMRWILPGRIPSAERLWLGLQELQSPRARPTQLASERPRACLGLFAACDQLGFSHVRGVPPHVYLEEIDERLLVRIGLRRCSPGESAEVLVRKPQAPEALFRACVGRDGVLTADVLQCWLDVAEHPSRGQEQAAFLASRPLKPLLGGAG